jgi:hypothetical protein
MAKTTVRRATLIVSFVVFTFLAYLFYYLLNFDYKVDASQAQVNSGTGPTLQSEIRVEEPSARRFVARFCLTNVSNHRVTVVDLKSLLPLYDVKLSIRRANGLFEPCVPTSNFKMMQYARFKFDRDTIATADLLPSAGLLHSFVLSDLFNLEPKGTYNVMITYDPGKLVSAAEAEFAGMGFIKQSQTCSIVFELPMNKTGDPPPGIPSKVGHVPESKKAEPAPAPAATSTGVEEPKK